MNIHRYILCLALGGIALLTGLTAGCFKISGSPPTTLNGDAPVIHVTYFYRTIRCPECIKIEALTKQTVEETFSADLAAGRMAWRTLNIDEPSNAHFEKDYTLTAQSVVLSEIRGGKEIRWKNLDKVWDLVEDDLKFKQYIQNEIRLFAETAQGT